MDRIKEPMGAQDDEWKVIEPKRARSTADRLPSASARLPPVFCCTFITMAKKRSSAVGMRSYIFSSA